MGSLAQNNCYHSDWVDFFVEERLDKQVKLAMRKGLLDKSGERLFEKLYLRLYELLPENRHAWFMVIFGVEITLCRRKEKLA